MISIATHEAAQMLKAGWTIEYRPGLDQIAWREPDGISGSDYLSDDLYPSAYAVNRAFEMGHIHIADRVIEAELDSNNDDMQELLKYGRESTMRILERKRSEAAAVQAETKEQHDRT